MFHSGLPVKLVPLEVTHTALPPDDFEQRLQDETLTSVFKAAVQDILGFFAQTYRETFGFQKPPVHDPCAVALVAAPELFKVCLLKVIRVPPSPCKYLPNRIYMTVISQQLVSRGDGCMLMWRLLVLCVPG